MPTLADMTIASDGISGRPTGLFLCVHNAGRSQMALGWFDHLAGDRAVAWSCASEPGAEVNPAAIAAMDEVGIDIREEHPKLWTTEIVQAADVVAAREVIPGARALGARQPDRSSSGGPSGRGRALTSPMPGDGGGQPAPVWMIPRVAPPTMSHPELSSVRHSNSPAPTKVAMVRGSTRASPASTHVVRGGAGWDRHPVPVRRHPLGGGAEDDWLPLCAPDQRRCCPRRDPGRDRVCTRGRGPAVGARELVLHDPDGYVVTFTQPGATN